MELHLETIINSLDDAIVSVDGGFNVAFLNEAAAKMFQCDARSAVGQPAFNFPALDHVLAQIKLQELDFSNNLPKAVRRIEGREPTGESVPLEASVTCATVEGRKLYTAVIRDISLQQRMERVVYESRKTQAIGALAGGIAHDFNNILTAIISHIDLCQHSPDLAPSLRDHLIYAQTSARRGAELVSKLQLFSRQAKPKFAPTNPSELIDQVVFMLRRSIDPRIRLNFTPQAKTWLVKADPKQIMETLVNLGLNARDAMPSGGALTLELSNVTITSAEAAPPRKAGEFVRISIIDTGIGMSPETLARLFEPYFSTKDKSRGPGLGLSIASSVVAEHGGWMEVESRVGDGSRFHVFLPRTLETQAQRPPSSMRETEGKERILVVDDEELVRIVTRAVLAYRGYQVVEAEDGEDAVEKYRKAAPAFDLVLMDMHMPRLNGHDALLRLREINPKLKAILLSGGLQERETSGELPGVLFLQKPFENQELVRTVRELLDHG